MKIKQKDTHKPKKKARKVPEGPIRNKERTRQKLIHAVGKLFMKEGYTGLNAVKIAATAKVDRKLIYLYFGSLNNLIESYFKETDFWSVSYNQYISELLTKQKPLGQLEIITILKGQFDNITHNKAFQKTIQWEISEKTKLMRNLADAREQLGEQLFSLTDEYFAGSDTHDVDIRAILALQIAGIYYLGLHAKINGSAFCGIDINGEEGRKRIEKAMSHIVSDAYGKVKKSRRKAR
jgi:AcrR family transcriptional regulator